MSESKCWFCQGTGQEYVGTGITAGEPTEHYRPCSHCIEKCPTCGSDDKRILYKPGCVSRGKFDPLHDSVEPQSRTEQPTSRVSKTGDGYYCCTGPTHAADCPNVRRGFVPPPASLVVEPAPQEFKADTLLGVFCDSDLSLIVKLCPAGIPWDGFQRIADYVNRTIKESL